MNWAKERELEWCIKNVIQHNWRSYALWRAVFFRQEVRRVSILLLRTNTDYEATR